MLVISLPEWLSLRKVLSLSKVFCLPKIVVIPESAISAERVITPGSVNASESFIIADSGYQSQKNDINSEGVTKHESVIFLCFSETHLFHPFAFVFFLLK